MALMGEGKAVRRWTNRSVRRAGWHRCKGGRQPWRTGARLPGDTPAKTTGAAVDDVHDGAGGRHGARGNGVAEDAGEAEEGGRRCSFSAVAGMGTRRWSSGGEVARWKEGKGDERQEEDQALPL